jgi:hypothetical protein
VWPLSETYSSEFVGSVLRAFASATEGRLVRDVELRFGRGMVDLHGWFVLFYIIGRGVGMKWRPSGCFLVTEEGTSRAAITTRCAIDRSILLSISRVLAARLL